MEISPFEVRISEKALSDLKKRLALTRYPDEPANAGWNYGIPLDDMKTIISYWQDEFDWRNAEKRINAFANFTTTIDGMTIHFIHERGHGPNPTPLLIPHGWPSSIYELLDLIPFLTDPESFGGSPEASFDVIIPSIPGHGFSDIPKEGHFEDRKAGQILLKLMKRLGYDQFGIHGYDLGASIAGLLCLDHPDNVIGYHTTSPGNPSPLITDETPMSTAETEYLALCKRWYAKEGGYAHSLSTKPQTYAYGLNDSPVGLAAFIIEKWHLWSMQNEEDTHYHFDLDTLLTNVSIYWFTETINSSNRFYYEGQYTQWPNKFDRSFVPLGVLLTSQAHERPPKEYVERLFPKILRWEELNTGGHFATAECPALLASHIRAFFSTVTDTTKE